MKQFTNILFLLWSLFISCNAVATLITDEYYHTYQGIDFAWASPVNVETWPGSGNVLYAPDTYDGWDFATPEELTIFKDNFQLSDFKTEIEPGKFRYKNAAKFWNSLYTDVRICADGDTNCDEANVQNLINGNIRSQWTVDVELLPGVFIKAYDMASAHYETLYVRRNPIPEPSTIAIFGLALIAFAIRTKNVSQL